jgi:uncharacterized membrane protein YhaH (DUF805 family)
MRALLRFISFEGRLGRGPYLLAAAPAFFAQHLIVILLLHGAGQAVPPGPLFWVAPASFAQMAAQNTPVALLAAMLGLIATAALAFARAAAAEISGWTGALAMLPGLQIMMLILLAIPPSRPRADVAARSTESWQISTAALGVLSGAGVCVAAVSLSTLAFGVYGYGLFVVSPLIVGAVAGYMANRRQALSGTQTLLVVTLALAMGAAALIAFMLEGVICIVMAMPLAWVAGVIGGLLGRSLAHRGRAPPEASVFAVAFLPALFAFEHVASSPATFQSSEAVIVAAPPAAVWRAVVAMGPIPERPSLPFRLGLAYPVDGRIEGVGIGAIRKGYFSTGVAFERITAWRPGQELAFTVLSDPPMLRELSPYGGLQTPHLLGYYHTGAADFRITPLPGGRSRLELRTTHVLKLDPAPYWLPFAEWAVHENKLRVLGHFKRVAEASLTRPPT